MEKKLRGGFVMAHLSTPFRSFPEFQVRAVDVVAVSGTMAWRGWS